MDKSPGPSTWECGISGKIPRKDFKPVCNFQRVWKAIFTRAHITLSRLEPEKSKEREKKRPIYTGLGVQKKWIKKKIFLLIIRKYYAMFYANKFQTWWINYFLRKYDSRGRKLILPRMIPPPKNSAWLPSSSHWGLHLNVTPSKKFPWHPIKNPTLRCYLMNLFHSTCISMKLLIYLLFLNLFIFSLSTGTWAPCEQGPYLSSSPSIPSA